MSSLQHSSNKKEESIKRERENQELNDSEEEGDLLEEEVRWRGTRRNVMMLQKMNGGVFMLIGLFVLAT